MKTVRLFKTGKKQRYDDASAEWLVMKGYAEPIPETKKAAAPATADTKKATTEEEAAPPAPRRGRPPKTR